MKKYYFLIIVALILGLVLTGCLSNVGQVPTSEQSGITYLTKGLPLIVGNDATVGPNTDTYTNFAIIDTNNPSSDLGLLDTFSYYAANTNPFRFVLVDELDVVQWVSEEITPPGTDVQSWNPSTPVYVEPDWNLGLYFASTGTVPFEYAGDPAWYKPNNTGLPTVGETLSYEGSSNRIYSFVATGEVADLPSVPTITWPANDAYITAAALTHIDWTDSTGTFSPLVYKYEAYGDANYTGLIYSSGWLNASEIPTLNTPEGVYYIRVQARDNMGNLSDWSNGSANPYKITVISPSIEIVKIASTTAAAPGETVTYTYTVTTDGALSNVTVIDNPAGAAEYVSGDTNSDGFLDLDETWIFTIDYIILEDAPEYLCNIATAEGWYKGNLVSADSNEVCIHTMCARTIGYWKNHLEDWCGLLNIDSIFYGVEDLTLLTYLPGSGAQVNGMNPLEMLRAQLLAAELNVACSDDEFDYSRYDAADIYDTIADAEEFLAGLTTDDLNAYWSGLSKAEQRAFKQTNAGLLALKDILDTFNNIGDECF